MKKYLNIAFAYTAAALAGGVFYREFTKLSGYASATALGRVHTHLFMLGTAVFLLITLFSRTCALGESRLFRAFLKVYNIGVPLMTAMMLVRGVYQVLGTQLSRGADAAISGVAGIGHLLTGAGLVLLLLALRETARE